MKRLAVLALIFTGCGSASEPVSSPPAKVTPVPSTSAPVPTPTAGIHASPSAVETAVPRPTVTPPPAEAGDEEGIGVPVGVTIAADRITVSPPTVPAFLPIQLVATNTLDRTVTVVVQQAGDGDAIARFDVAAGASQVMVIKTALQPGTAEILSPDLDPDATAVLTVERSH